MTESQTDILTEPETVLESPARLEVLRSFIPDFQRPDTDFDDIVRLAARVFSAPAAMVTVLDGDRQWFKARIGTEHFSVPARDSFCVHTVARAREQALIVLDAAAVPPFEGLPTVTGAPLWRFYAGVPLLIDDQAVGTVCVFDTEPRAAVAPELVEQLHSLGRIAVSLFKLKDESRRRALKEAALSREEQRHGMALEAANVGSWLWDIRSGAVSCNAAMTRMFQMAPSDVVQARDIFAAINQDDRAPALAKLRTAIAENGEYHGIFRVGTTGRWLMGRGRVHERDAQGKPTLFLGINIDVTEEQISTQRTRLLLRELNHRVKNTLAMLQSLARQTLRTTSDPQQFMTAFAGRLQAISEAHGLLSDHEWGEIRLSALLLKQLSPHVRDYEEQIEVHKDEILLGPDQAVGLGLVLHELATNAAKYGALSTPRGKIVVTARCVDEDGRRILNLTWTEVGGPPVTAPERRGFGTILIERSLDKVMGSAVKTEYLPAGVTAIVRLPL